MPTPPPLSPRPQRATSSSPHPEFAALLSTFETPEAPTEQRCFPGWRSVDYSSSGEDEFATPRAGSRMSVPEITTTSPSPLRPGNTGRVDSPAPSRSSEGRLSPLPSPPLRSQLFGQTTAATQARMTPPSRISDSEQPLALGGDLSGPDTSPLHRQPSTQSSNTIDAAYEGVFNQLDALANPSPSLSFSYPTPPSTSSNPSRPFRSTIPPVSRSEASSSGLAFTPLEAVSERTEPVSATGSRVSSPRDAARSDVTTLSATSIARRFPLPPSPVKGAKAPPPPAKNQSSPSKASELIRMFESRSDPILQPSFALAMSRTTAMATASTPSPEPITQNPPRRSREMPSSYRPPAQDLFSTIPSPPGKTPSPLSNVRTMIASWRARAGSPIQRVVGSPGRGADVPKLFGRDRGWNVSIRRRRRNEGQGNVLAEQGDEPALEIPISPATPAKGSPGGGAPPSDPGRTPSLGSVVPSVRSESRALTGQVSPQVWSALTLAPPNWVSVVPQRP